MRKIKYSEALAEATVAALNENPRAFVMGEGVDDPKGVFGSTLPALKKFGGKRVFDSPLSESAVTGIGIGAAIEGSPCVMVHMRNEFLLLGIDQVINHAAKWTCFYPKLNSWKFFSVLPRNSREVGRNSQNGGRTSAPSVD